MAKKNDTGFVNPLAPGVTCKEFVNSIPDGVSVEEHLKANKNGDADFDTNTIAWLVSEIEQFKNNSK